MKAFDRRFAKPFRGEAPVYPRGLLQSIQRDKKRLLTKYLVLLLQYRLVTILEGRA